MAHRGEFDDRYTDIGALAVAGTGAIWMEAESERSARSPRSPGLAPQRMDTSIGVNLPMRGPWTDAFDTGLLPVHSPGGQPGRGTEYAATGVLAS